MRHTGMAGRPDGSRTTRLGRPAVAVLVGGLSMVEASARAASLDDAQRLLRTGQYVECIAACKPSTDAGVRFESWWLCRIDAELALGRYGDALASYQAAVLAVPRGVRVRLLGRRVLKANDRPKEADAVAGEIIELVTDTPRRFGGIADRVTYGRALLLAGLDARRVLEQVYDPAKKEDATAPEPLIASGELALEKNDFAVAAESFDAALKLDAADPDTYVGLARAYADDSKRAAVAVDKALAINPRHADALLLRADDLIDREAYAEAAKLLDRVIAINPKDSRAWAYRAVLANLASDAAGERAARQQALSSWKTDPAVDHLIGLKLSQKYRFAEGRAYQEKALAVAPDFTPAKTQLCQDLLRLGDDSGWRLADEVFKADPYNVLAYNLTTLHDTTASFRTVAGAGVNVRMDSREADLYGRRVIDLLGRAQQTLTKKYDVDLPDGLVVEIFPKQKDFAIRTFGLPGGAGYLGVCFGRVITVNSPASRVARPTSWEAVLWHEYCHAVTLHKTRNKMPRWLSEGISVHEETLANPPWGQAMSAEYREIILGDGATPVSKLSGAFLNATTPQQVQFAYFESSMVVKYVVDRFGAAALNAVLDDLGAGVAINDALGRRTVPIEELDKAFDAWLRERAKALAPDGDLNREGLPIGEASGVLAAWNRQHPNNVWGLLGEGQALLAERQWQAALVPLRKAAKLYPAYAGADGPHVLMAEAYRELKDAKAERNALEWHINLTADAVAPRLRLMELALADRDWPAVKRVALETLAINPLTPAPHQYLATAAEAVQDRSTAVDAREALLVLDAPDPSGQHYAIARLLAEQRQFDRAKRHVLQSLEETPRYRAAQRLLLDIVAGRTPTTEPSKDAAP